VRPEAENLAVAQRSAVALALADAVRTVVERHASASAVAARARDVRNTFFAGPASYVQRYAITSEGLEGQEFVVTLEADVDEAKVLADLRTLGIPVRQLAARPRVLVAALGGEASAAVVRAVRRTLEAQGFVTRDLPGAPPESADAGVAAAWGRTQGCHVTFAVSAERVGAGEGSDVPASTGARAEVLARGWAVETRAGRLLGQAEGQASAWAGEPAAAAAVAAGRAGIRLGNGLVAALEQSDWGPGEETRSVDLEVQGIPGPAEVEALQRALPTLTEVRGAALRSVGFRRAVWRIAAADTGLGWEAVVSALRLPKGRIAWLGSELAGDGAPEVVRAEWLGP
jgi:hypothetical protein